MKKLIILAGLGAVAMVYARRASANMEAAPLIGTDDSAEGGASGGLLDQVQELGYQVQASVSSDARSMSPAGLRTLQGEEGGYQANVYNDSAGLPTIGYGHKLVAGEAISMVSYDEAAQLLAHDVRNAEDAVNGLVTADLLQAQFDALVSFVYNVGAAAFRASTLRKKINAGDSTAVNEFARWRFVTLNGVKVASPGLVNRRLIEAGMWQGIYA